MIYNLYCYRNLKGGFYTQPIVSQFDTEQIIEMTQRSFVLNKGTEEHAQQKEVDLYHLGTFDDKTGEFVTFKPCYLCSFNDVEVEEGGEK